ncbi:hypothetical protein ABIB66_007702 [Bradyrhizobium sp. F1.13.3]
MSEIATTTPAKIPLHFQLDDKTDRRRHGRRESSAQIRLH